mmetsp:Transcript_23283/g.74968  ORF Transcript_23283/g.74968 Transcript_23283/m.74968 type:complete len:365 (+) Transcript_23283:6071-7165(+)
MASSCSEYSPMNTNNIEYWPTSSCDTVLTTPTDEVTTYAGTDRTEKLATPHASVRAHTADGTGGLESGIGKAHRSVRTPAQTRRPPPGSVRGAPSSCPDGEVHVHWANDVRSSSANSEPVRSASTPIWPAHMPSSRCVVRLQPHTWRSSSTSTCMGLCCTAAPPQAPSAGTTRTCGWRGNTASNATTGVGGVSTSSRSTVPSTTNLGPKEGATMAPASGSFNTSENTLPADVVKKLYLNRAHTECGTASTTNGWAAAQSAHPLTLLGADVMYSIENRSPHGLLLLSIMCGAELPKESSAVELESCFKDGGASGTPSQSTSVARTLYPANGSPLLSNTRTRPSSQGGTTSPSTTTGRSSSNVWTE